MRPVEASGRSVEEAVDQALRQLGAAAEDVEVEVLDPGARGVLGLGTREARVRVTLKEGQAAAAHQLAERLVRAMGYRATVRARETPEAVLIELHGQDLGALIGRRGSTLEAIEVLLGAMVGKVSGQRQRVIVDVEGYWARRRDWLEKMAQQAAERVRRSGRPVQLPP
ncbi:MAG TPA: RNA-binding cell elongation regulator Jag/EloR, partial [bacterium]|nr:RNA-binding cell elongation regulator Jag/EloR [bacterium]